MASDTEGEMDYESLNAAQNRKNKKAGGWQAMGLDPPVFRGVTRKGYRAPTPIQRKAIPLILDGKDVVAMARTGSGKTAAFLLPMLHKLKGRSGVAGARALLISPTRELALQTFAFAKQLGKYTGLRAAVVVGGDAMEDQFALLHDSPDVIIATPGRLLHVVVEMNLRLASISFVVFDEADRLFEMGFAEQLKEVLARLPESRQTLLFSATLPRQLVDFARAGLSQPVLIRLDVDTKVSEKLEMTFLACRNEDKVPALLYLLRNAMDLDQEQTIIFCATKHHVEYVSDVLDRAGFSATSLYSSMDHTARNISIGKFRAREVRILVVTDIAARGVDIPFLDSAINFHFPAKAKLFVHRVGRVARAGRGGRAMSLVSVDELPYLLDLFLFLGRPLKIIGAEGVVGTTDALGAVPQAAVDVEAESMAALHAQSEISDAQRVADNAAKQYLRSRPPASTESVKRVKNSLELQSVMQTPDSHPHPLFSGLLGASEAARTKLLAGIKNYRSPLTIFENRTSSKNEQWRVMKAARKRHGAQILGRKAKLEAAAVTRSALKAEAALGSGPAAAETDEMILQDAFSSVIAPRYHDANPARERKRGTVESLTGSNTVGKAELRGVRSEHFIPFRQKDFHQEQGYAVGDAGGAFEDAAAASTLDMTMDETRDMYNQTRQKKWDARRKKYVGVSEEPGKRKIRTESGLLIPASFKSDRYARWQKKQKVDAAEAAEVGFGDDEPKHFRPQFKGRKFHTKMPKDPNAAQLKRKELKNSQEILSSRKKKERKESYQKYRQGENAARKPKGSKGGGPKGPKGKPMRRK